MKKLKIFQKYIVLVAVVSVTLAVFWTPLAFSAEPDKLVVLGHRVHKMVATAEAGKGEDIITPFLKAKGLKEIEWITLGVPDIQEKLFREAGLEKTTIDVAYLLADWTSPRIATLFEPLNLWMEKYPLEDPGDFYQGMWKSTIHDGKQYAIPVRGLGWVLAYNKRIFKERGIEEFPKTIEELYEIAKKVTFTLETGEKVYAFAGIGEQREIYSDIVGIARAWDGDIVTPDYQVVCNEPPMVNAVTFLNRLYQEGLMPPDYLSMTNAMVQSAMKAGRIVMQITPANYYYDLNNPETSKEAGNISFIPIPPSKEFAEKYGWNKAAGVCHFWALSIPIGAQHKELSWEFIRHLTSKESQLQMALNGNGPTRLSVHEDERFMSEAPYASVEKEAISVARLPWPPFDNISKANDLIGREVHLVLLGKKTPQQAMDDAAKLIKPLLP